MGMLIICSVLFGIFLPAPVALFGAFVAVIAGRERPWARAFGVVTALSGAACVIAPVIAWVTYSPIYSDDALAFYSRLLAVLVLAALHYATAFGMFISLGVNIVCKARRRAP